MAVKAKITADEFKGLAKEVQEHYAAEKDGHHLLDVTAVGGLECVDTAGLKSALASERDKSSKAEKAAKDVAAKFDGIDPEAAKKALTTVAEMDNWDPEKKLEEGKKQYEASLSKQYADKEAALLQKHETETAAVNERLSTITDHYKSSVIQSGAVKAIAEAGGSAELLLPHVERQTRMKENDDGQFTVEVFDDAGIARVSPASGNMSPMTIAELVGEMKTNETYGRAFDGSGASGAGSGRSGAGAPAGSKVISRTDTDAVSANIEGIAKGEVTVE
jgi:hypothetical protein